MIPNKELRKRIVEQACKLKMGHVGSALSGVDAIAYLYRNILKPEDIFILSKGHGAMALYPLLEEQGKYPEWKMHPEIDEKNGIYATTGSLGHGLPIAIGRAFAKKLLGEKGRVYVLVGDCELMEGSMWESLIIANALKIDIVILVDWNKYGAVCGLEKSFCIDEDWIAERLRAFGCKIYHADGHDEKELEIIKTIDEDGINAVILDTVKGKGIPVLEQTHYHGFYFHQNQNQYNQAVCDLSEWQD